MFDCIDASVVQRSKLVIAVVLQAKIHPYFPYFHVDVAALVFMFQPVLGAAISMPLTSTSACHQLLQQCRCLSKSRCNVQHNRIAR